MPSPFPGMDPYVETCGLWEDFHNHLIDEIYRQLADVAPERYLLRTSRRDYLVIVEEEGKKERPFLPDVSVSDARPTKKPPRQKSGASLAAPTEDAPATMRAFIEEEHRETFVEILENASGQPLVTAIEVLSPSNKTPKSNGRELYLRERQSLMLEGVNLVEIDLLLGGEKMPMLDEYPAFLYTLLVARSRKADACKVWPAHFNKPLPSIPVPLLKGDADLTLRLQPLIDDVYRRSRYDQSIDYDRPLAAKLAEEDAAWLLQRLQAR